MKRRLVRVAIEGLFGYVNHSIELRPHEPTILSGPNGTGKTHLLGLIRAALAIDSAKLLASDFSELDLEFEDGWALTVTRLIDGPADSDPIVHMQAKWKSRTRGEPLVLSQSRMEEFQSDVPAYYRKVDDNRWYDRRTGRTLTRNFLERRIGRRLSEVPRVVLDAHPQVAAICAYPEPIFIDTKRLDVDASRADRSGDAPRESTAAGRIHDYIDQMRMEINEARRSSIQATQSADLSFAARAIAAGKASVRETDLHKRYNDLREIYEALSRNSLAIGESPLEFPEGANPTIRRILNVFLDDWEKRLAPLRPLNEKILTIREILDDKLYPSGKRTVVSPRGLLEFRSDSGSRIRVSHLSSGEQHLVALFTLLLFSARPGSVVLIDEPEISLHAAWKHAFLKDIGRIAEVNDLQIILATHSTGIINGRWDLVEELSFSDGSLIEDVPSDLSEDDDEYDE